MKRNREEKVKRIRQKAQRETTKGVRGEAVEVIKKCKQEKKNLQEIVKGNKRREKKR